MSLTPAPTVRESLEAAVESITPAETPAVETPAPVEEAVSTAQAVPAEEPKTPDGDRPRNADGTFAKGKAEEKPAEAPKAAAPAAPAKPKAPRPTSWKKELEAQWDTLPPEVQAYVQEREKQYATGVSTYKGEADRAKGITTALAQFEPMLQKKGIATDKWIQQMGIAHYLISEGTPRERVEAVAGIIKNNGIDIQALGQLLAGQQPQYQQPQYQPQSQPPQAPVDIGALVEEKLQAKEVENAYRSFEKDVADGKYPHFADDEVKGTMAELLQAGLAQDYPSAYEAALALPKHRHLAAAATPAPAPAPDPAQVKAQAAVRARSQAVSVKSSTPSAMAPATGPKGLRDTLAESFDLHTAPHRV